jgi:alkylation response protein AidB-like acyl-CoA dehydrogenase
VATFETSEAPGATLTESDWLERAREVGRTLAADVVARDRANEPPTAEIALLRESKLLTMLGPLEHGGGGMPLQTAYRVVRELSRHDASIAMLLGYSYIWSLMPQLVGTPEQIERYAEESTRNQWLWAGVANPRDPDLTLTDTGDHVVFNGRKHFSTGGSIADVLLLAGMDPGGSDIPILMLVPAKAEGLRPMLNWDALGVRLSDSGGMDVAGVRAEWKDAFGYVDKKPQTRVSNIFGVPVWQLLFTNMYLGIAQGALDTAAEYTRTKTRPPFQSEHERAIDDPYVLSTYGELAVDVLAAEALVERAGAEVQGVMDDLDALTERRRGEVAVLVSAAKVIASRVSLDATSRIFDVTGARATASSAGLDRFWRDVRTHSLHDSIAYKVREVGIFFLRDDLPEPTWYT